MYALLKLDADADDGGTLTESENDYFQLHIATIPEVHILVGNIHGITSQLVYLQQVADYEPLSRLSG